VEHGSRDLAALAAAVETWHERGRRYGEQVKAIGTRPSADGHDRAASIDQLLRLGDRRGARDLVLGWLHQELAVLPSRCAAEAVFPVELLRCLADVVERTSDQTLLEVFWRGIERIAPPLPRPGVLPLLGVPVLNRPDLLERLLDSLDVPVGTLAIVDNSGGREGPDALELRRLLQQLETSGWPGVEQVRVARSFGNAGVAAAWNQILLAFPDASVALIANNDVVLAPGVLETALHRLDPDRPQFLPLLPEGQAFSAFLITALAWDRIGLFDDTFHPAYCEDLDYRDRLLASEHVNVLDGGFAHAAMAAMNPEVSATIGSDQELARSNRRSYQLNRLWYLHRRRQYGAAPGQWKRRWLTHWR
jgi:hypothetical protein